MCSWEQTDRRGPQVGARPGSASQARAAKPSSTRSVICAMLFAVQGHDHKWSAAIWQTQRITDRFNQMG